jgi:hypothetical protein
LGGKLTDLKKLRFGTSDTLLSTFDKDFIRFELFPRLTFAVFCRLARESDLHRVLLLKTNGILAALTDKRSMVLRRNLEDFRSFISLRDDLDE